MTRHHPSDPRTALLQHRWLNRLQTGLLVLTLVGIAAAAGRLPFGEGGLWLALFAIAGALLLEPVAASALSLRLYRVRALHPQEAHKMWALLRELPARAGLPATPVPHYVPSAVVNAFATGSKQEASIALTDGLLRSLSPRELATRRGWRPCWQKSSGSAAPGVPGYGRDGAIPSTPACVRVRQRKSASHAC